MLPPPPGRPENLVSDEPERDESESAEPTTYVEYEEPKRPVRTQVVLYAVLTGSALAALFALGLSVIDLLSRDRPYFSEPPLLGTSPRSFVQLLLSYFVSVLPYFILLAGLAVAVEILLAGREKSTRRGARAVVKAILQAGEGRGNGRTARPERQTESEQKKDAGFPDLEIDRR